MLTKYNTLVLVLLSPVVANAQFPTAINEADMQKMMADMQKVEACYKKIDQGEIQALQQKSEAKLNEIQGLCKAGKRSEAQSQALAFATSMLNDSTVKKVKACAEKIPSSLKAMIPTPVDYQNYEKTSDVHVCDSP